MNLNKKLSAQTTLIAKTWAIVITVAVVTAILAGIIDFMRGWGTLFGGTGNSPSWVDSVWLILKSPINSIFFVISLVALISILGLGFKFKKIDKYVLFNFLILIISFAFYLFV
jgi:hypothetical protein